MPKKPKSSRFSLVLRATVALSVLIVGARAQSLAEPFPLERQILWQRTLDDALLIAKAQHRPILIAVNMDGESASERIVRERYHDPEFVALTRSFVCLPASIFRHSARDHDDQGRRIVSLRFGEVTSGEHYLLEPLLYDKYLGGERIAPRHAVIQPDGTKTFDLSLLFDFKDLDAALADAAKNAPPPQDPEIGVAGSASARSHRGRLAFEERLADPRRGEN